MTLLPVGASAQTGNELQPRLNDFISGKGGVAAGWAAGYVYGVSDSMAVNGTACFPPGVTLGQQVRIAQKHLEDSPTYLHFKQYALVFSALAIAFPCPKDR